MRAVLPPRAFAPLLALLAAGCFNKIELAVAVIAPDGGNPFHGPDAATQVRATVENGLAGPVTVPVAANGGFTLGLDLTAVQRASRLRIEALRDGMVVGSGATPPVFWDRLAASVVPVYMQRSDTVVPAPPAVSLETPRTAPPWWCPSTRPFVAVFGGNDSEASVDVLDLFNLGRPTNMSVLRAPYTGALHAINLDGVRVLVLKGCQATVWNSASNTFEGTGENVPPPERCEMTRSTLVQDPLGGAYLVGGLRMGVASARVDRVRNDGTWVQGVPMVTPRVEPAAVIVRERELLVLGGQSDATRPRWSATASTARRPWTAAPSAQATPTSTRAPARPWCAWATWPTPSAARGWAPPTSRPPTPCSTSRASTSRWVPAAPPRRPAAHHPPPRRAGRGGRGRSGARGGRHQRQRRGRGRRPGRRHPAPHPHRPAASRGCWGRRASPSRGRTTARWSSLGGGQRGVWFFRR